jgi:hypothetical protein
MAASRLHRGIRFALVSGLAWMSVGVACGSRTGLLPGEPAIDASVDVHEEPVPDVVDAHHEAHVPAMCSPRTCQQLGYECGSNGDGCGHRIECGTCPVPQICGAGGYSQCGGGFGLGPDGGPLCTSTTCQKLGFTCGFAGDGCGGVLQCGVCQFPDACGGAGTPGHCGNTLPCTNLCQQQVACTGNGTTSVSGMIVTATPTQFGSADPVYNALVYVPNAPVQPFQPGVQCSQCGADVTGQPLVAVQTGPDGTFQLDNMPVGTNIPLVIQLGRWRRQVTIPTVPACTNTVLPTDLTRLPRNRQEGDIPLIAIATGKADQTECLLMKMGIDQAEFTQPTAAGRVQMYVANGSDLGPGTPAESSLTGSLTSLEPYDIVLLPCEGEPISKPATDLQNLVDYTSAGGRVFATHYSYEWLISNGPFATTATWSPATTGLNTVTGVVDTSFKKGQDFATWLQGVGALSAPDQLQIQNARQDLVSISSASQQFLYTTSTVPQSPLQFGFNTPVGQPASQQCGRLVFSDFHVIDNGNLSNGTTFPAECTTGTMSGQEKALEFQLFDLASCIQAAPHNCKPLTCADQQITCGPAGDGCGQELDCGKCASPQTCGGGGVYGQCGYPDAGHCVPQTCAQRGYQCGINGDGCGNAIFCGACTLPAICGGGGVPNVCGGS